MAAIKVVEAVKELVAIMVAAAKVVYSDKGGCGKRALE